MCFCWLSFCKQPLWICYLFSFLFATMLFLVLRVLLKKVIAVPSKQNKKNANEFKFALAFLYDFKIFAEIFEGQGYQCKALNDAFWLAQGKEKILLNFAFRLNNLGAQDLVNANKQARKEGATLTMIFCLSVDPSLWKWQKNFPSGTFILDFNATMNFLKQNGKHLAPYKLNKKNQFFNKDFFYFAFSKNRSKHYLSISVVLLIMSLVSFFPVYEIIVATICFCASIYSAFNKRFNPQFFTPRL